MRMALRITRLERACPPVLNNCPACGDIDPATGEGLFYPGIMLDADDGTHYCLCKGCHRSFRARLTPCEDGGVWATEVVPAEMPV